VEKSKFIVKKILENSNNKQLYVIIDKKSGFTPGSYVKIEEVL